jgi:Major intrinsic protein
MSPGVSSPSAPLARSTPTPSTEARGGWHWAEWGSEFAGTGILLFGGLSGLFLDFAPGSPVAAVLPGESVRLLITGLILGATGLLVTVTPFGRRSGAHLNPSVSLAFWRRGHMHPHDLIGYVTAQTAGAVWGTLAARWCWGARATALDLGPLGIGRGQRHPPYAPGAQQSSYPGGVLCGPRRGIQRQCRVQVTDCGVPSFVRQQTPGVLQGFGPDQGPFVALIQCGSLGGKPGVGLCQRPRVPCGRGEEAGPRLGNCGLLQGPRYGGRLSRAAVG